MRSFFDDDSPSNLTEYSVSELSGSIKRTVETTFDHVRVRGEISGYRGPHSSGHAYFSLKDDKARIDAVIWKGTMSRLKFRPEEGMEVIATGKVTTFPGSSKYQIVIETLEPEKRPVNAVADHTEVKSVVQVTIRISRHARSLILFDQDHSGDERILAEQFRY